MELSLEPVDVWLFRDGKSFDALSDHRARSLFPPYPTVIQGAIRSHHLVVKGIDLRDPKAIKKAVGTAEDFGSLRMRGPFIAKKENDTIIRYFPVPADAVFDKAKGGYRLLRPLPSREAPYVLTNAPDEIPRLLWRPEGCVPSKEGASDWLTERDLLHLLSGKPVTGIQSEDLFLRESRFGIGRDDVTHTTREGALYEVEFIRLRPGVGLWVQVKGYDDWPQSGTMRIGGEGRGAHFTQVSPPLDWPQPPDPLPRQFKVYFASPTYFEDGWKPKGGWEQFFEGEVTLQAAAIKGYESIGRFDIARGRQKPGRRYVPAGSVYYFTHNGSARLKPNLLNNAMTELWPEIGFGQVIISEWKEERSHV